MKYTRYKKTNKRGLIPEIAVIFAVLFIMSITFVVGRTIYDAYREKLYESDFATDDSKEVYDSFDAKFTILDNSMIFIVIALTIALVVSSFLIPSHPAFLVINLVGMIFLVLLAMIMANTNAEIVENEVLINASSVFSNTSFLLNNLPWICIAVVLLASIVNFARGQVAQQY